jgi:hypothetical protein
VSSTLLAKYKNLNDVGLQFWTDKSSARQDWLRVYEKFFASIRQFPIKILQIGVAQGASVKTWEAYFPNAIIIGADIDRNALRYSTDRIFIEIIDKLNVQSLGDLGIKYGSFDIIIEDGSYCGEHQIFLLRLLFPFLVHGGFYAVEDLQTNLGVTAVNCQGDASISYVEYLKKLQDYVVIGDELDSIKEDDAFLRNYANLVEIKAFCNNLCLIQKVSGKPRRPSGTMDESFTSTPFEQIGDGGVPGLVLMAHIANIGDVTNWEGPFITTNPLSYRGIEGFELTAPARIGKHLQYRARLEDGIWTEWVDCGTFVGSRGKSQNLTGFSFRLRPEGEAIYDLEVIGSFAEHLIPVRARGGQDCVSPSGKCLDGMQVVLSRKKVFERAKNITTDQAVRSILLTNDEVSQTISAWCNRELKPWRARVDEREVFAKQLESINQSYESIFLYHIEGNSVFIVEKSPFSFEQLNDNSSQPGLVNRAKQYKNFFESVASRGLQPISITIAVDLEDKRKYSGMPIFSFQKRIGEDALLLPDIDFLAHGFYEGDHFRDELDFDEKSDTAIFIGSTTGVDIITRQDVENLTVPRIHAALFFKEIADVDFRLPNIVQCDSPETEELIKSLGVGGELTWWRDQFRHKFIISMDGNGATCSRVAVSLKSNSALLKYNSEHLLHYFGSLEAWKHYIPIAQHEDILEVIKLEKHLPGMFEYVADASRDFYNRYLTRDVMLRYTHELLLRYAQMYGN